MGNYSDKIRHMTRFLKWNFKLLLVMIIHTEKIFLTITFWYIYFMNNVNVNMLFITREAYFHNALHGI